MVLCATEVWPVIQKSRDEKSQDEDIFNKGKNDQTHSFVESLALCSSEYR